MLISTPFRKLKMNLFLLIQFLFQNLKYAKGMTGQTYWTKDTVDAFPRRPLLQACIFYWGCLYWPPLWEQMDNQISFRWSTGRKWSFASSRKCNECVTLRDFLRGAFQPNFIAPPWLHNFTFSLMYLAVVLRRVCPMGRIEKCLFLVKWKRKMREYWLTVRVTAFIFTFI